MEFIELKSGTSVEGAEIKAYRSGQKKPKYLYLMAGTHGDEVEGVYVLQKLFDWLSEAEINIDLPFIVLPILNPDGYRAGSRLNSHGVDLNRNLKTTTWSADVRAPEYHPGTHPLSEPENVFLDKLFQSFPPKLILSFHSWKPMINYNDDCLDIAQFLHKYNKYEVAGDIGYPTPGSLGTYAPEAYQAPVITFECPKLDENLGLNDIWQENEEAFKELLQSELLHSKFS